MVGGAFSWKKQSASVDLHIRKEGFSTQDGSATYPFPVDWANRCACGTAYHVKYNLRPGQGTFSL